MLPEVLKMERRGTRIAPLRGALAPVVLHLSLGIVLSVLMQLFISYRPISGAEKQGSQFSVRLFIVTPFVYAIRALIFTLILCWLYNLAVKITDSFEGAVVEVHNS
jgi:hypothetical protein